jgi:outer membrane protein assembly factor BamB
MAAVVGWRFLYRFNVLDNVPAEGAGIPVAGSPAPLVESSGSDWPRWRGANGANVSLVTGIRKDWSGGLDRLWEVDYLTQGKGNATWSSPVVRGNRLVVTGRDDANDLVFCLDPKTGGLIWRNSYEAKAGASHGRGARATPTMDGDRVYTFGRSGDLACWRLLDGDLAWKRNVKDEGGEEPEWGYASAPLVHGNMVIVQAGGSARSMACDKMMGDVVWKSGEGIAGYAAPVVMPLDGVFQIIVFHGSGVAGLVPGDGRQLWEVPWRTSPPVHATTPVFSGDVLFVTSGYNSGGMALSVSAVGAEVLWTTKAIASHHSDPLVIDGFVYGYSGFSVQNLGYFKCVDLATGEENWSTGEIGWGTAVMVDGLLVCLDIQGNLFLVRPDPDRFVKVSEFRGAIPGTANPAWTIPVVAQGNVYLRHKQRLICYRLKG